MVEGGGIIQFIRHVRLQMQERSMWVVVKYLDKECFQPWHLENEYYGYIPKEKFESVRTKYLDI